MDLHAWTEAAKHNLKKLAGSLRRLAPGTLYGALSTATLLPVVAAANQGDFAALVALTGVVGGVGGNLIANRLQAWKERSDEDLAVELHERALQEPAWREALDALLHEFQALPTVQAGLDRDDDRAWFDTALREELAELGNLASFEATLTGSGAIAQGAGATAAGQGGIAIGTAQGPITIINQIIDRYHEAGGDVREEERLRRQVQDYLAWVQDRAGTIELRGIKREGQQVVQLDLETVYVPLAAADLGRRESGRRVRLDEILGLGQRLIVTGGPGSGKTTVLQHIAWTLACAITASDEVMAQIKLGLNLQKDNLNEGETLPVIDDADAGQIGLKKDKTNKDKTLPLPILIPLSAYAQHRRELLAANSDPHERTLAAFISRYLIDRQSGLDLPRDFFALLLTSGKAVILLLDGLDEVPNEDERAGVRQAIEDLVTGRETMRVVVTCRTAAFHGRTALGKGFREVRVNPLDEPEIEALVRQAYAAIYAGDPTARRSKGDELLRGIHDLEAERRRRLGDTAERLVTSPLLVRMLLVVHYSERRLPDQRAELYMKATDAMLLPEYLPDEEAADRIGRLVGGREIHRELAQHLAFAMHRRGATQGRNIGEDELRAALAENSVYVRLVDDLIALTKLRGTLLEERLGDYRFVHLAFQEYLVARYLAEIVRSEESIASFLEEGPILESWWREPALLVVGYLSVTSPLVAQRLLRRLAGIDEGAVTRNRKLVPDVQMAAAEVAATALLEWQVGGSDLHGAVAARLVALFRDVELMNRARPVLRAAAGDTLARLGDPRFRAEAWYLADEPLLGFVEIAAGPFVMGSDKRRDGQASNDELPQHEVTLPGYYMVRYPVTVAQFRAFVEDKGYKLSYPDSLRDLPTRPVRYVTWYDAMAYCEWLTERLREWEKTPEPLAALLRGRGADGRRWRVTLPSEAEWEKAARGGLQIPAPPAVSGVGAGLAPALAPALALQPNPHPRRIYPWGDEIDVQRANYDDTGIGTTSAVGCFPGGASSYGIEELSGNVWEWTCSLWGKDWQKPDYRYPYDAGDERENLKASRDVLRVLRGGWFSSNERSVRCAYRRWNDPDRRNSDLGFRVVVSPL